MAWETTHRRGSTDSRVESIARALIIADDGNLGEFRFVWFGISPFMFSISVNVSAAADDFGAAAGNYPQWPMFGFKQ